MSVLRAVLVRIIWTLGNCRIEACNEVCKHENGED